MVDQPDPERSVMNVIIVIALKQFSAYKLAQCADDIAYMSPISSMIGPSFSNVFS
jgi:hypothetical protein